MENGLSEYRREVQRVAAVPGPLDAAIATSTFPHAHALYYSPRSGLWADYLYDEDGEEGANLAPEAWDTYAPTVGYYALWWDAYAHRTLRRLLDRAAP